MKTTSQKKVLANRALLLLLAGAAIVTTWSACTTQGSEKSSVASAALVAPGVPVDVLILKTENLNEGMDVSGTLQAKQEVNIMSELSRKVISVHFTEGKYISKGQLLFKLDDADLRAQLDQLHQQEKLAKLNEARLKDLISNQAVMQQDYDQTITNLKVLQAQIRQVQVAIEKTYIRAPFSGKIGIVNVYPGALVSPGTSLATL
ncbi:MAG: family efflux transporter, subunit, partial [Daejeonella sp.]|nr:family efflux transporter, subunit [Daejeonella sp.]